jgi:DegT/DnrJ/EryC1/StrS aminotransferase family
MLSTSRHSIPRRRVLFDRRTRLDDPYLLKRCRNMRCFFRAGEKHIKIEVVNLVSLFYRVPLAMPYWNGAVHQSVLDSFCSGCVIDGADLDDLRSRLVQELGVEDAILCGSGSLALEIALRTCKVARGDEVVIPTFCCTAVVAPILAAGATPVLADIGEELNLTV